LKFISSRLSKAEILEELPKLNAAELREIHDRILQPQEADLFSGTQSRVKKKKRCSTVNWKIIPATLTPARVGKKSNLA